VIVEDVGPGKVVRKVRKRPADGKLGQQSLEFFVGRLGSVQVEGSAFARIGRVGGRVYNQLRRTFFGRKRPVRNESPVRVSALYDQNAGHGRVLG
jgi:hypothetical protein